MHDSLESSASLRPATAEDLPKILDVECRAHVSPWTQTHFQTELTKPYSTFWVLTDDETDSQILGYIIFWFMFDECQILNLAVDLGFRGLGFAKYMMSSCVQLAVRKGLSRVVLEVRKSNLAAIQLYQNLGFTIRQLRKEFYSNGEDAYQMTLDLGPEKTHF